MSDVVVVDTIRQRRSIRKYVQRPVRAEVLSEILDAARWAPSAHNAQPWRFIVLADKSSKRNLAEAMAAVWLQDLERGCVSQATRDASVKASLERFIAAPVLVLACLTMEDMDVYPDEERQRCERDLAVQSLAAAIQNLLLTAHAKGLGACWYCAPVFCKTAIRQALKLPEDVEPQALIVIGYPAEKPSAPPRMPLRRVAYLEMWGRTL